MAFGKRSGSADITEAMSTSAPRRKIFPDEVWEGKTGDMLRTLGMKPDDKTNFVPDANSVNARLERDQAQHEERVEEANRRAEQRLAGARVRPFSLIPDPCWNGETGRFLMMRLDLFPYDEWNMVFLPADERTTHAFDKPQHPGRDIPVFVDAADKFMKKAEAHLIAAYTEAGRTHDFEKFAETKEEIQNRVRALAAHFLAVLDEAWQKNKPQQTN